MYLVRTMDPDGLPVQIEGKTYLTPAVMEDRLGARALLLADPDQHLSVQMRQDTVQDGVAYRVIYLDGLWWTSVDGQSWREHDTEPDHTQTEAAVQFTEDVEAVHGEPIPQPVEPTRPEGTFVHLHTHTHASALDGYSTVQEIIEKVLEDGQTAIGVADHGNCVIHPELSIACAEAGLQPIFGMEAYLVEDRHRRSRSWYVKEDAATGAEYEVNVEDYSPQERKNLKRRSDSKEVNWGYQHITLWAMNDEGLKNLWAMSTEAYRDGLVGKNARLDYDTLERHAEGVIASTGCLRGPLAVPFLAGDEAQMQHNLARLMDIFGDRFYVEIHTNSLADQKRVNERAVQVAHDYGLPMIAAVDSHYARESDADYHRAWVAMQTYKSLVDESEMFQGSDDYHLLTEAEVRDALSYLGPQTVEAAVSGTVEFARRCTAQVKGETDPPVFTRAGGDYQTRDARVARDEERLDEMCRANWQAVIDPAVEAGYYTQADAEARYAEEMSLLRDLQFTGYYLLVADYVGHAKDNGCLVGPGRGSGGASLVARLARITGLDPIRDKLHFGRFLNRGRKGLPDFDVDFPSTWREPIKDYLRQRWGGEHTLSIGTVMRVRAKAAMDGVLRVLKGTDVPVPTFAEIKGFKAAVDESAAAAAGTDVPWERFVTDHEEMIQALTDAYPVCMDLVAHFVGRINAYGRHPAGVVVSPDRVLTDLPSFVDTEGNLTSQFDMNALEALGLIKFDVLTLRTLDTLQQTLDLIEAQYGVRVDVESWNEEYEDPQVWEQIADGHTLGMFQIETSPGQHICRQVKPASLEDLAAAITIVRPGPSRSGLTDSFLRRRFGHEEITYVDDRLAEALHDTYGVPIYQEQIMAICMILAGYDEAEADDVRRVLGKKKVEAVAEAGVKFIAAATERGMGRIEAETLWAQMAEFAKYSFNLSHADGYAVLGYWTGWLKEHFPIQFLAAVLSTVDSDRVPTFVAEARRMGYAVALPDVNASGVGFTPADIEVRYGLSSVPGVGVGTAEHIIAQRPYTSLDDFRDKAMGTGSPVNAGHLRALVKVGALDGIIDNRRAVVEKLEADADGSSATCVFKDPNVVGPNGLPCTFDWDNEPDPPMQSRGRGKNKVTFAKPPPARCTRACRNFTPPPPVDPATVVPYTDREIRAIEREMLGVYVSSTPFDQVSKEDLDLLANGTDVNDGPVDREYVAAATVEQVRERTDSRGDRMAFVTLNCQDVLVDAVIFASLYTDVAALLDTDDVVFVSLWKTRRGVQVQEVIPLR